MELELSAGLSVCCVFPGTDKPSWLEAVLGKFPPKICVLLQWNQLKGVGLYTTNTANSWQFLSFLGSGSELEFLLSVGEVKTQDSAVLSAPERCCAGV